MTGGGRLAWLIAGMVATVTGIAIAAASVWFATHRPSLHSQLTTTSYAGQPDRLVVQLGSGDITVTAGAPGTIKVTRVFAWSGGEPRPDERWQGRDFVIGQDCPGGVFGQTCVTSYRITVPPGVALNLDSASGNITVLRAGAAQVLVNSDSGNVRLSFAAAPAAVRVNSASGDVSVLVPYGDAYAVQADAASGSSDVTVTQDPDAIRSLTVTSDSGNIRIGYG